MKAYGSRLISVASFRVCVTFGYFFLRYKLYIIIAVDVEKRTENKMEQKDHKKMRFADFFHLLKFTGTSFIQLC